MASVNLMVCDHCDARDNLAYPPLHNIKSYNIRVGRIDAYPDLCEHCYELLQEAVQDAITQRPAAAQSPSDHSAGSGES